MRRDAEKTKDPTKKEEKETERLVRESPSNKPPRHDRSRGRVQEDDPDLDSDKKDMSLNYKDVGGSVCHGVRIARMYQAAKKKERFLIMSPDDRSDHYRAYDENYNLQTFGSKKEAEQWLAGKKKQFAQDKEDRRQKRLKQKADEARIDQQLAEKKKQKQKEEEESAPEASQVPRGTVDADERERALEHMNSRQKDRVREAAQAMDTFPPNFNMASAFSGGSLTPEARTKLVNHFKAMDEDGLLQAYMDLAQTNEEAEINGTDEEIAKAKALFDAVSEVKTKMESVEALRQASDVLEALMGETELNQPVTDAARSEMDGRVNAFVRQLKKTPSSKQAELVRSLSNENFAPSSIGEMVLQQALSSLSAGISDRTYKGVSMTDALLQKLVDNVQRGKSEDTEEGEAGEGERNPAILDPRTHDLQTEDGRNALVRDLEGMSDADLARLVQDNPYYRMSGGVPKGEIPEDFDMDPRRRLQLLNHMRQNLRSRAFFNELRMQAPSKAQIERLMRGTKTEGEKAQIEKVLLKFDPAASGEDSLMVNIADLLTKELGKMSKKTAAKKQARYRGAPGPLLPHDSYAPPSPEWSVPDPLDLSYRDYARIVHAAVEWLARPGVARFIRHDRDAMERQALDLALYSSYDGRYQHKVDAPTYNVLLGLLTAVTADDDPNT